MNESPPIRVAVELLQTVPPSWLDVFSAFLTPVIAVITVYIAIQQYRLSRLQFLHESYERRLQVYKVIQRFLSEIVREGKTDYSRLSQFYSEASEAAFLFDSSVQEYIENIYKKGVEFVYLYEQMYPADGSLGLPVGDERGRIVEARRELIAWYAQQLTASKELFRKKMGIAQ